MQPKPQISLRRRAVQPSVRLTIRALTGVFCTLKEQTMTLQIQSRKSIKGIRLTFVQRFPQAVSLTTAGRMPGTNPGLPPFTGAWRKDPVTRQTLQTRMAYAVEDAIWDYLHEQHISQATPARHTLPVLLHLKRQAAPAWCAPDAWREAVSIFYRWCVSHGSLDVFVRLRKAGNYEEFARR